MTEYKAGWPTLPGLETIRLKGTDWQYIQALEWQLSRALDSRQYVSDEDKRDAERYRWMRENDWDSPIIRLDYDDYENAKGEKLDTAVDAARGISPNEEKS